jgi:hypothetical protein
MFVFYLFGREIQKRRAVSRNQLPIHLRTLHRLESNATQNQDAEPGSCQRPLDEGTLCIVRDELVNGAPIARPRPVVAADLAGFRPMNGMYASVPASVQQWDFLQARGFQVVHIPDRRGQHTRQSVDGLPRYDAVMKADEDAVQANDQAAQASQDATETTEATVELDRQSKAGPMTVNTNDCQGQSIGEFLPVGIVSSRLDDNQYHSHTIFSSL